MVKKVAERGRAQGRRGRGRRRRPRRSSSRATRPTGSSSGGWPRCTTTRSSSTTGRSTSASRARRARRRSRSRWGEQDQPDLVPPAHDRRPAGRRGRRSRGWDPKAKQPLIGRASAPPAAATTRSGRRARDTVALALGGGSDRDRRPRRRPTRARPTRSPRARSTGSPTLRRGRGHVPRQPDDCAPARSVKIDGVGQPFSGDLHASPDHAHATAAAAATRPRFRISGRSSRTPGRPAHARRTSATGPASLVVGVVTKNDDPDEHGPRAREVPGARRRRSRAGGRASRRPSAGNERGLLMMPQVDDEVLVALRARRRAPPVRARLALERRGQARATCSQTGPHGSFGLKSDQKVHIDGKKDDRRIAADENADRRGQPGRAATAPATRRVDRQRQARDQRTIEAARHRPSRRVERDDRGARQRSTAQGRDGGHQGRPAPSNVKGAVINLGWA